MQSSVNPSLMGQHFVLCHKLMALLLGITSDSNQEDAGIMTSKGHDRQVCLILSGKQELSQMPHPKNFQIYTIGMGPMATHYSYYWPWRMNLPWWIILSNHDSSAIIEFLTALLQESMAIPSFKKGVRADVRQKMDLTF